MLDWVLEEAQAVDLYWLECPYTEEAPFFEAIREARRRANKRGILTAGAELKTGLVGYAPMLNMELYDVLMPDMKHVGGYDGLFAVARAAATKKMLIAPHNPTGPVCHGHSVHASAAVDNFLILEMQFDESTSFTKMVEGQLPMPHAGMIAPSDAPGLGLRLKREALPTLAFQN
jgi:galactonate dehydratase